MGCNCGGAKAPKKVVYTAKDGSTKTVGTETEAKMLVARRGGSYKIK